MPPGVPNKHQTFKEVCLAFASKILFESNMQFRTPHENQDTNNMYINLQPNDYANNWSMIKRNGADTLENFRPFRDPQNMYGFSNFTVTVRQPKRRQQLIEQFENPLWFQTLIETFWGLGIDTIDNNHRFKAKYRLPTANQHPLN
jgi:hypothetical protein